MATRSAGYSGVALPKKLGLKAGQVLLRVDPPPDYRALVQPLPPAVKFVSRAAKSVDFVHLFVTRRDEVEKHLKNLHTALKPDACIWVSWPKKSAGLPTQVTEATIREVALPLGFVDVKVCAVDVTWTALKVVVRKENRGKPG